MPPRNRTAETAATETAAETAQTGPDYSQYSAQTLEKKHGNRIYQWTMMPAGVDMVNQAFTALDEKRALLRADHDAAVKELEKTLAENMALLEDETGVTAALGAALVVRPADVPVVAVKKSAGVSQAEYRRLNADVREVNRAAGRPVTEKGRNSKENIEYWEQVRRQAFPVQ